MSPSLLIAGIFHCIIPELSAQGCPPIDTPIWAGQTIRAGVVEVSNSSSELRLECHAFAPWKIQAVQIYAGLEPVPTNSAGNVASGQFPYKTEYDPPVDEHLELISLSDLGASCGDTLYLSAHFDLVQVDANGNILGMLGEEGGWAHGKQSFTGARWGWWDFYSLCCMENSGSGGGPVLTTTPPRAGGPAVLTLDGASPGSAVVFYYSSGGVRRAGSKAYPNLQGPPPDLTGIVRIAGTAFADANGTATLSVAFPARGCTPRIVLQAVVQEGSNSAKSDLLTVSPLR
ncbi:MAG: hypothetical protein EYC70_02745 [Planctomycetota bacterium]|nr:MAG: hypothetical protein EYC70_02745 [Planctomycetota bacterium]